jgi:hypothetical protein
MTKRPRKVYVASKSAHAPTWRALRSAGLPVSASWIDWPLNTPGERTPSPAEWCVHWDRCIEEASAADVTLSVAMSSENQMGGLIETGAALESGKTVFVVSTQRMEFPAPPQGPLLR